MARAYQQGSFIPKNPHKYVGDVAKIFYRSSWEKKFMIWADNNPAIEYWNSEEIVIPYFSPVDQKTHRYFTDFAILVKQRDGTTQKYLIEIKPKAQTLPPVRGKRSTNKYLKELATFAVNRAKWEQAELFCKKNAMQFLLLTEDHLF